MILMQLDNDQDRESFLVMVIEPENLHRMEQADPLTFESGKGGFLKPITYPQNFRVLVAYEKEPGRFYEMMEQGRTADMLRDLMRGYQYGPKDGKTARIRDWEKGA